MTAPMTARILVVDGDVHLAGEIARHLAGEGHAVNVATDGPSGLHPALETLPDLVVLDAELPGLDGVTVCRQIREVAPIPVMVLTDRGGDDDRLLEPGHGADDYLIRPFSTPELAARVEALLRRTGGHVGAPGSGTVRVGEVDLDLVTREVTRHGEPLSLSAREVDLLAFFARHPGRAFTRQELLASVWGWTFDDPQPSRCTSAGCASWSRPIPPSRSTSSRASATGTGAIRDRRRHGTASKTRSRFAAPSRFNGGDALDPIQRQPPHTAADGRPHVPHRSATR